MYPSNNDLTRRISILRQQKETLLAQRQEINNLLLNIENELDLCINLKNFCEVKK